jgi:hypothetical protein
MSKEKIIGLSVIGVLTATLAGVSAWRMMGGKATSGQPAAIVADDKAQAAAGDKSAGPTVLASATATGTDSIADRLSGKTKIKGGWETAAPATSAPVDPTLPTGAQGIAASGSAAYDAIESVAELNPTSRDQDGHPSYMPRETIDATSPGADRYGSDIADAAPAMAEAVAGSNAGESYAGESTLQVPNELTPDPNALASSQPDYASTTEIEAAAGYETPEQEAVQIVEHQPIPPAQLTPQDPAAQQVATRAADDARFAQVYAKEQAKEQEKVAIAEAALAPQPTSLNAANEVPNLSVPTGAAPSAAATTPARFTADPRFAAADERYASTVENKQPAEALSQSAAPADAAMPVAANEIPEIPPRAGNSATAPASETVPVQPGYRESVYREPAAVSGAGSAPISNSTQAPTVSTATPPASDPYATKLAPAADPYATQTPAAPYGTTAKTASISTGTLHSAVAEKQVPQRENTGKYYVEPGDSFWIISQKVYGNGGFFKALQEHNRARFITPSNLQVGDEVLTPSVAELRDLYSGLCPKERIAKPGSPAATQAAHLAVSQTASVRQYEVQDGDTLFDIARYELGDAKRWPEIYQLNRVAIGQDIDHVKPGTKLMLPMDAPIEAAPEEEGYRGDVLTRKPGDIRK